MADTGFYNGPQLAGAAISASVFAYIDATATPDTVIQAVNGTTSPAAMVSTVALDSGQVLYGIQDSGMARIKCVAGYTPVAGALLTATTAGEAAAATTADHVYAVATEPATGSGGYVMAMMVNSPVPLA